MNWWWWWAVRSKSEETRQKVVIFTSLFNKFILEPVEFGAIFSEFFALCFTSCRSFPHRSGGFVRRVAWSSSLAGNSIWTSCVLRWRCQFFNFQTTEEIERESEKSAINSENSTVAMKNQIQISFCVFNFQRRIKLSSRTNVEYNESRFSSGGRQCPRHTHFGSFVLTSCSSVLYMMLCPLSLWVFKHLILCKKVLFGCHSETWFEERYKDSLVSSFLLLLLRWEEATRRMDGGLKKKGSEKRYPNWRSSIKK